LQQFAYRQLMYLVLLQSATTALTGGRLRWHKLNRAGLAAPPAATTVRVPAQIRYADPAPAGPQPIGDGRAIGSGDRQIPDQLARVHRRVREHDVQ
jgi:hypothetical protein